MTPYVSRYRRILVIGFIGLAWSCVEGRVRKSTACSSFGSGSVNNPSQGIPGPFSFKRLLLPTLRGRGIVSNPRHTPAAPPRTKSCNASS